MTHALVLDGVTKRYGAHVAVRDVALAVPAGTVYGILGPNGAGKSTTLRVALGILARDAGRIELLGADPALDRAVLRRVGYLPEERGLYRKMRVLDAIVFFARLKGVGRTAARRAALDWLERMGLAAWRNARVETLSKGMQQKVQFITAVIHEPDLLVLDEPHAGLDPVNQELLRQTILDAARQGRTVILSTHLMEQAEQLCDAVCIIARGRKVLDGPIRELRRAHRGHRYAVEFDAPAPEAERLFERRSGVLRATRRGPERWEIELAPDTPTGELLAALARLPTPLHRFERIEPSLHEIFVAHVRDDAPTPPAEAARV